MKKTWFILLFTCCMLQAWAQQYNNEWIDYNKTYYKFKIGANGLYRIPQSQLAAASATLAAADAATFQLWRNGTEVPLYTTSASGVLAADGYIEFWGEMNDGKQDNPLYRYPDEQINDKWSLFTDSATYFLTINPAGGNRRLQITDNNIPSGATPEPYFLCTTGNYYKNTIHPGYPFGSGSEALYSASFEYGEGFTSTDFTSGSAPATVYTESNLNAYQGSDAPPAQVRMNVVGNSFYARNAQLLLNGTEVLNQQFATFNYEKLANNTIPVSLLSAGSAQFKFTVLNSTAPTTLDRVRIANIELTYPRVFNFGGASQYRFRLPARSAGTYLEIAGFNVTGTPVLYDLANGRRYTVDASNTALLKVFLQASGSGQDLVLVNQDATAFKTVATPLIARNFVDYSAADKQGDYLMITHNNILNASDGSQPVEAYRQYRSSAAGGGYNAKIYMIDQLTDQFGFGIKNNILSVRNFLSWARAKFPAPPRAVFLIGKGVAFSTTRLNESLAGLDQLALIPTFGNPGSDVLLSSEGPFPVPLTAIGRVSVINGNEFAGYFNKMKEYESAYATTSPLVSESAWKKNVAHVVGANDEATINLLYGYLNADKPIIRDTSFGAFVTDFVKQSTNQTMPNNSLANLMGSGLGLLTYFGHSSTSTVAFNLESPANFSNAGKYPVFSMMGCNVGDIFVVGKRNLGPDVISEKQVLAPQGGCIGMMAGTSLGYPNVLAKYNEVLYKKLSGTYYGGTLGALMQQTISEIINVQKDTTQLQRMQCEEFVLNGDPAIRFYQYAKPDYVIEAPMLSVNPSFISVAETKFTVSAKMMNLGKAINTRLVVELKRTYPNQVTKIVRRDTIAGIRYIDSLNYTLAIDPVNDKGANKLTITLDPDNITDELYESNNSITKDIFIYEDEVRPVYPYNYAIVNNPDIRLEASTANPLAPSRIYMMEIDTTKLFNSSAKRTASITSAGGVIAFNPGISFTDSTVYYWRVATKPVGDSLPKWNTVSFTYMAGKDSGYNQSHVYQFLENEYRQINIDSVSRRFKFDQKDNTITARNGVWGTAAGFESQLSVDINTDLNYIASACGFGFVFNVFDGNSLKAWKNQLQPGGTGLYSSRNPTCSANRMYNFEYDNTATGRNYAYQFLQNVPDGNLVILRLIIPASITQFANTWKDDRNVYGLGNTLYDELLKQGFGTIDSFSFPRTFTVAFKKNSQAIFPTQVIFSQGVNDLIALTFKCFSNFDNGIGITPVIGPAKAWKQLQWDGNPVDSVMADNVTVDVLGIKNDGTEDVLLTGLGFDKKQTDISFIDPLVYRNIRLRMNNADTVYTTPYQLKYWRVLYAPAPEGAIAPNLYFSAKDTLQTGEPLQLGIAFKNVSTAGFDSVKVKLSVRNKNNQESFIILPRQKPVVAGDTIRLSVPIPTHSLAGNNTLYLNLNPDNDQPEQFLFNNFLYKSFYVVGDSVNPYLDVTFDGVRILNKDIVSGKPDIVIKLSDESKWQLLNNPDMVKVQLRYPNGAIKDFNYSSDTLIFHAASSGNNNQATVNFKPYLTDDGTYELIVSGKDGSGNTSGTIQYKVAFQVINKPMISNMLNYPNPFTTSTAFVFTLTGSEVPQNLRIQILTITGKIVKEITKTELGPLRIGRNITEYKWDGTDQYGQKLANGVYLYRVITNLNGKSLDKYNDNSNTDKYFNKGYGKMYLMR